MHDEVIVKELAGKIREHQEILLANLVMMGETPAPTFQEQGRVRFLLDRFRESELHEISSDEVDNGVGLLRGADGKKTIGVFAHLDTLFGEKDSHTLSMHTNRVKGVGLGDNSVGAAVLVSLPTLLERLGIEFRSNVLFAGVSRSIGRGNLGGIRFLLENGVYPVDLAMCLEGVPLGRLNYSSLAMIRGEIRCSVPDEYDFSRFGVNGAIVHLNWVINQILKIPRPTRPRTSVIFGSIEGGNSFGTLANEAILRFEIRSESDEVAEEIWRKFENIQLEGHARFGAEIDLDVVARRNSGGLPFDHPLVEAAREVMAELDIEPQIGPSMSELAACIDHGIPAVTMGLTKGYSVNTRQEEVTIEDLFEGIAQVVATLVQMDALGEENAD